MEKWLNRQNLCLLIGPLLCAISVNCLAVPSGLGEGGVVGLTMILFYLFKLPTYISNFILNGCLLLIGFKLLPRRMVVRTLIAVFLTSLFLKGAAKFPFVPQNTLLAAVFAGLLMGVGIGLIYLGEATNAGSTLIAKILQQYFGISASKGVLFVDLCVVLPSVMVLGMERMLLTLISIYLGARAIAYIVEGAHPRKAVIIISQKQQDIAEALAKSLQRGITILQGEGYYSKQPLEPLFLVVDQQQIIELSTIVSRLDEEAFVVIFDVQNVFGNGFDLFEGLPKRPKIIKKSM